MLGPFKINGDVAIFAGRVNVLQGVIIRVDGHICTIRIDSVRIKNDIKSNIEFEVVSGEFKDTRLTLGIGIEMLNKLINSEIRIHGKYIVGTCDK